MSFVTFSFPANVPQFREIVCAILLMAPVNFRWTATQMLPSVRYLTRLDEYGIGCLIISILVMSWNSIVGSNLITSNLLIKSNCDTIALISLGSCAILFNIIYIIKLLYLYRNRRKFEDKIESIKQKDCKLKSQINGRLKLSKKCEEMIANSRANQLTRL